METLCPDEAEVDESAGILPVIFYMGREESGIENLKSTTLRSLGLTSGGAILRQVKYKLTITTLLEFSFYPCKKI